MRRLVSGLVKFLVPSEIVNQSPQPGTAEGLQREQDFQFAGGRNGFQAPCLNQRGLDGSPGSKLFEEATAGFVASVLFPRSESSSTSTEARTHEGECEGT